MPRSKLILLEGIPGSGKSTAATAVQSFLENKGIAAHFWREGDFDHPADFEGIACLSANGYQDLLSRHPELAGLFWEYLAIRGLDHLLSYRKLQRDHPQALPQPLFDELSRYDVYDGLPMAEYRRLALDRWQDFHRAARDCETVTILECCLLQNPFTVLLARHDAAPQSICQHIRAVAAIVRDLDPVVIYLSPQSARAALEHVRAERLGEWADFVAGYLTGQAYGQSHHLDGFEGVIRFYETRQKLEVELLRDLPVQTLLVEHAGQDWERCHQEIVNY